MKHSLPAISFLSAGGRRLFHLFIESLLPTRCAICRTFYRPRQEQSACPSFSPGFSPDTFPEDLSEADMALLFREVMAPHLCSACAGRFTPITPPFCPVCGKMFKSKAIDSHICGACIKSKEHFTQIRAVGIYDDTLLEAIHLFKYRHKTRFAMPLGRLLFTEFLRHWTPDDIDLVVPVPLHIRRFRQRGYNQAYMLVHEWERMAKAAGIEMSDMAIARDLLVRTRYTPPQVRLRRQERRRNIRGAFEISRLEKVREKRILLIDDVFTTGATVEECAKVLMKNGAAFVDVLVLARVDIS